MNSMMRNCVLWGTLFSDKLHCTAETKLNNCLPQKFNFYLGSVVFLFMAKQKTIINHSFCGCKLRSSIWSIQTIKKQHFSFSWVKKNAFGQTYHVKIMLVKQCHLHHPHSHDHFCRWYVYNSESYLVYGIVLPTLFQLLTNFNHY